MKYATRLAYYTARTFGLDPRAFARSATQAPRFFADLWRFRRASTNGLPKVTELYPILNQASSEAGTATGHYFHQDLWAARCIFQRRPASHVDVGSRVDGFVAHLLSFGVPVTVVDIRPLTSTVAGLSFVQADATNMSEFPDQSVSSLSSLHAVEHFGLGRYGDAVDPHACFAAMRALARVVAPGGRLYFAVPIGRERVVFNAHRILSPSRVVGSFPGLTLDHFAAVDDAGNFVADAVPHDFERADYACGLYEFTR